MYVKPFSGSCQREAKDSTQKNALCASLWTDPIPYLKFIEDQFPQFYRITFCYETKFHLSLILVAHVAIACKMTAAFISIASKGTYAAIHQRDHT